MPDQSNPHPEVLPKPVGIVGMGPEALALGALSKVGVDVANSPEASAEDSVWADFGGLGGEKYGVQRGKAPELPIATEARLDASPSSEEVESEEQYRRSIAERQERKLGITEAKFDVSLDREAIRNILNDHPELLPERADFYRAKNGQEARREDLQATLDAISRLPGDLHFEPGLTLIVGENGLGKSTLNRAFALALAVKDRYEKHSDEDFDKTRDDLLDPDDFHLAGGVSESRPNPLSVLIAHKIDVAQLDTFAPQIYYDATVLNGQKTSNPGVSSREDPRKINMDLTYGRSHGQTIREGLFGHLKDTKESYQKAKETGGYRTVGPGVMTLDEVENGLSPRNHRKLKEMIADSTIDGSIVLCATNSEVLFFDPTLPRIDLEYPELGIHKPTDHPEVYDLQEFNKD